MSFPLIEDIGECIQSGSDGDKCHHDDDKGNNANGNVSDDYNGNDDNSNHNNGNCYVDNCDDGNGNE